MKSILTLVCLLCFSAGFVQSQNQEISKTFKDIKKINISTSSGSCKLLKSASNEVQVKVTHTYSSGSYQPIMEQDGKTLVLKESFEDHKSYSGNSSWILTIPENMEVRFSSGSGDFEVAEMSVKLNASTGSGNYRWSKVKGESRVTTGSGSISIEEHVGNLDVNTGSGDIEISKSEGDLHANTGSGNINLGSIKGSCAVNVGSGDIRVKALTLTGKGSFNSGSGDASVSLTAAPDYDLSVNSGSGDAILDFKGNKIEGKVIMTANKKNGKIVAPFTFDKTEELNGKGDQERIQKTVQLGAKDIEIRIGSGSGRAEIIK